MEDMEKTEEIQEEELAEPEPAEPEPEEDSEVGKPKPGDIEYTKKVAQRIGKVTAEKYQLLQENKKLRDQLKDSGQPMVPNLQHYLDEYGNVDYTKYNQAMSDYTNAFYDWKEQQRGYSELEKTDEQQIREDIDRYSEQIETLKKDYPDIIEVTEKQIFSPVLRDMILNHENSAKLAYYLGKRGKVAVGLGHLSPPEIAKELDKINENILSKKTSQAPEPLETVEGDKGTIESEPKTDEEWFKRREKKRLDKLKAGVM